MKALTWFAFLSILAGCVQEIESEVIISEYEDGSVKKKRVYPDPNDSSQYIRLLYLQDGSLADSCLVVDKQLTGIRMFRDTVDWKIYRTNYENGIEQGHCYSFYPNGQLYYEGWNENGISDGEMYFYEEDGSLLEYNFYISYFPNKSGYRREYDSSGHYKGFKGSALFNTHWMEDSTRCGQEVEIQFGLAEPNGCISSIESISSLRSASIDVSSDQRDYEKRILVYSYTAPNSNVDTIAVTWKVKDVETLVEDTGTVLIPVVILK